MDKRTQVPVIAVLTVTGIAALLTLINVGSPTAFSDVISLTITGFYGSYFLPASLLLYHRIKGNVLPHGTETADEDSSETSGALRDQDISNSPPPEDSIEKPKLEDKDREESRPSVPDVDNGTTIVANAKLIWGPWHVPGILGAINNAYACTYMIFVIFWSVWPPVTPVTASTMNYSVLVTGGVLILSTIWYFVRAKTEYKGPTIDREVAAIMRAGSAVSVS